MPPTATDLALAAIRSGGFRIALLPAAGKVDDLGLALPVRIEADSRNAGGQRKALGAVVLRMSPAQSLFPLVTAETVPTLTGEMLLFQVEGSEARYLSPFRHAVVGREALQRSRQQLAVQARAAAAGRDGIVELADYRGIPTFGVIRWLMPIGWGLVLKIDRAEALAEFRHGATMAGLAGGFLAVALAGLLVGLVRHRQRADLLDATMRHERTLWSLRSYAETIVASVPSGLVVLSGDLRILSANRAFLQGFGLQADDVLGKRLEETLHADGLLPRLREALDTGIAHRELHADVVMLARRESRPARITMTGIRVAEDEDARLLLVFQDLSEEERLQAAHRASEQRFHDLVQDLDAIVWEADAATHRFTFVSQRAEALLGFPAGRWLTDEGFWASRIHGDDRERALALSGAAVAEGKDHEVEYRATAADGRVVWLRDIVRVTRDAAGQPCRLRGLTVDLTERKRAEEALRHSADQLRQAQKMEAVGQLAGGIAHDFNNLLMVILGDSDVIRRRLPAGHPLRRHAEGIQDAAHQAATLTRQLLAFSRRQVLTPRIVDLNGIIEAMHPMLQRLLGETIQLRSVPRPDLGSVRADPGQIEQVILNLAVNARDAMPDGGTLTIETGHLDIDETTARQRGASRPGRYVTLEVTDTGFGMDEVTLPRVFEPFFTTKAPGQGTGLGLSTVYGIVSQSGGCVSVDSAVRRGTTVTVCLPLVERDTPPGAVEHRPDGVFARGRETVLLVEDADRVREVVREILEVSGYRVLEAHDGLEALDIARRHDGPIHLLVADMVMPQMGGPEVAQRLLALRPQTRVLYMSGYADDAIDRHGCVDAGSTFIAKPFTPDALAAKVREVLEGPLPVNGGANGRDLRLPHLAARG